MDRPGQSGFTLVELVTVMAVVSIILSFIIPQAKGMLDEASLSKVERELETTKAAITSYWRNHDSTYPAGLTDLLTASPQILTALPADPWNTGALTGTPGSFAYLTAVDSTFGPWFLVCSQGPSNHSSGGGGSSSGGGSSGGGGGGGGGMPHFDSPTQRIVMPMVAAGDNSRCISNAPLVYMDGSRYAHPL